MNQKYKREIVKLQDRNYKRVEWLGGFSYFREDQRRGTWIVLPRTSRKIIGAIDSAIKATV